MPRRHMNIAYVLSAQEHRSRRLDHAHTCGIGVPIAIPLAGTRHAKLRQQRVKRLGRYRNAGPVMPELQDIDIAHFPHIRFEFIPLGITGQQNAKAPACPLIGNIQHRRVRVLVATYPGIRPNKLTDEGADSHCIALAQLAHGGPIGQFRRNMVRRTIRNVQPIDPHTLENIGKAAPMVLIPMRDHNTVEPKDMIARQGRPSRLPYPRINKQRRRPVAYQDRISLPDIEHNDLGRSKAGPIGRHARRYRRIRGRARERDASA